MSEHFFQLSRQVGQSEDSASQNLRGFQIGPLVPTPAPLHCIKTHLALKDGKFYKLKIFEEQKSTKENIQGKILIHNEIAILDCLKDLEGIEKCHGIYFEHIREENSSLPQKRITLVLGDSVASDKSCENWMNINLSNHNINLQEYISLHKTSEREALLIFYDICKIVEKIHQRNIIHRDLKLQNFLINLQTRRITLTNFQISKMLSSEDQLLLDQRGSPAYISPGKCIILYSP